MPSLTPPTRIAPSLLSSDFGRLAEEAQRATEAGADQLHLDIMDGHFVNNLTMGPAAVAAINRATEIPLDVHLMIYSPYNYIEPFVQAGADSITFHFEATEDVQETIDFIRRCNIKAGLALSPETTADFVSKYLPSLDMVLLMTVHPGFGGQAFMPEVLSKIEFVRETANSLNLPVDIQVDGGIDDKTVVQCREAGANVFVAGSYLFKQDDLTAGIQSLR